MKIIVGLGNPGKEYDKTRHNIGFMVIDNYARKNGLIFSKKKFNAVYTETEINGEKVILIKPMEYMNLSGQAVAKTVKFFKVALTDILIIQDDLDIDLGKYKLKNGGNDGGHNGIRSVIQNLSSNDIKRLKIGIGNDKTRETRDFVLERFNDVEQKEIDKIIDLTTNIIDDFVKLDFVLLMNKYN